MQAKNEALKDAGAVVPDSFEAFEGAIKETYDKLVAEGKLVPQPDTSPPSVPLDLEAAKKAGKVGLTSRRDACMSSHVADGLKNGHACVRLLSRKPKLAEA